VRSNDFAAVFEAFDSIKNSGYTLGEIISTSTDTLIDREEYMQYRRDQGGEEEADVDGADEDMDEDEDMEVEVWEEVPAEMTRAVAVEETQVAQAIEASRASAEEDGQVREAMEASLTGRNVGREE